MTKIQTWLVYLAGTISTAVGGAVATWLLKQGIDIEPGMVTNAVQAVMSVVVFVIMVVLDRVSKLEVVVKLIRFGQPLPTYKGQ
jgi:hypothetical protein